MKAFWQKQIAEHGFRTIFLSGILYTAIFGYLWLTAGNGEPNAIANSRTPMRNGGPAAPVDDVEELDLSLDPERWKQRPLPHFSVMRKDLTVVSPEEFYDVTTDRIASNRWIRQELDEGLHDKFEWQEFIDLSATRIYDSGDMNEQDYPYIIKTDLKEIEMPRFKYTTVLEASMLGRLYLKHRMMAPYQILALPDPKLASSKEIPPAGRRHPVRHKQSKRDHRQHAAREHHELERLGPLLLELDGTAYDSRGLVSLPERLFEYDPYAQITALLDSPDALAHLHAISMTDALARVEESPKYFYEILIQDDKYRSGDHYDWRFFRGFLSQEEQGLVKERLMRAWSQFADAEGIAYWLAHGSMIGWFWNGMTMPWDTDNDIQVPVWELDRLGREFNGTLVLQHPNDDDGKFYIDVSPWHVERGRGNGRNVIDARFIDVETGAYIDITGLTHTRGDERNIGCKNNHFYSLKTLSPIRRSLYEGAPVFVNHKLDGLRDEYKNFAVDHFEHWQFDRRVGVWLNKQSCEDRMRSLDSKTHVTCLMSPQVADCDPETAPLGTCDQQAILMHEKLQTRWDAHQLQNITADQELGEPSKEVLKAIDQYHFALGYV